MSSISNNRALPTKESALFKSLLQLYETRQYKKALKTADQILKKVPEHGETTSMKGLVLTNLHRKAEGIELVKTGVRLDITSHICWHVYGIVHKADRNYEEALKCYTRALKFDKENISILRDAAQLQIQLRYYDALEETRLQLLRLRPNLRLGWIGLAVAYHLNGKPGEARKVMEQYLTTLKGVPDYDTDFSELLLWYVKVIEDTGNPEEAMRMLDTSAKARNIVDKTAISVVRSRLLFKLGRLEEAASGWRSLIEASPETTEYYKQYLLSREVDLDALTDETRRSALGMLKAIGEDVPKANAPKRISLTIASGDDFKQLVEPYVTSGLTRGIPSLFADVKSLYVDEEKAKIIGSIAEAVTQRLSESAPSTEDDDEPSTYIWSLYFLAQHHSHISPVDPTKSLHCINLAISHTPTVPELHMIRARILKRAGDSIGAVQAMEEARSLDLQDRFLNTKAAKYLFRDGQIEEANGVLGLFTKKDAATPGADLEEMQSLFYMSEEGNAYRSLGKLSMSLKRYRGVDKIFSEFEDDQYDFHSYCLRRHTLNSYEALLTFEDKIRSHPTYVSSALSAAEIYMRVHDDPKGVSAAASTALGDQKVKKKKAKKGADQKAVAPPPPPNDDAPPPPPKDEDPDGMKLLAVSDPLEQAIKLTRNLEELCPNNRQVWVVAYELAIRRRKYLQALRALEALHAIQPSDPELHHRLVAFKSLASSLSKLPEHTQSVITEGLNKLIPSEVSLEQFNTNYLQHNPNSGAALLGYAKALYTLRPKDSSAEIEEALLQFKQTEMLFPVQTAQAALLFLKDTVKSTRAEEFRLAMVERLPFSTIFRSDAEKATLRKSRTNPPPVGADLEEYL